MILVVGVMVVEAVVVGVLVVVTVEVVVLSGVRELTAGSVAAEGLAELVRHGVVQDWVDRAERFPKEAGKRVRERERNCICAWAGQDHHGFFSHSPVHVDAGLCEHEVPQVHQGLLVVHGGEAVVDQESSVGHPQRGEDHHHAGEHLHHLQAR